MTKKLIILLGLVFLVLICLKFLKPRPVSKSLPPSSIKSTNTPEDIKTAIILVGDVMLGRSVMTKSLKLNDPTYPFKKTAAYLSEIDIVFANLESPIVSGCPKTDGGFKFCADPRMVEGLVFAGVDVVNLANNHILNYGIDGLEETKRTLAANGIKWVGDDNLVIIEKSGVKFGFLGFDFVTQNPTESDYELIKNSDQRVDTLIVGVHWGNEYTARPSSVQREVARRMIENGAGVVVGHHPHWVQDIEYLDGKPVYYSLGNFVFDQPWSEETKKGLVVELTFNGEKSVGEKKQEIFMKNLAQPEWLVPKDFGGDGGS